MSEKLHLATSDCLIWVALTHNEIYSGPELDRSARNSGDLLKAVAFPLHRSEKEPNFWLKSKHESLFWHVQPKWIKHNENNEWYIIVGYSNLR